MGGGEPAMHQAPTSKTVMAHGQHCRVGWGKATSNLERLADIRMNLSYLNDGPLFQFHKGEVETVPSLGQTQICPVHSSF